MAKYYTIEEFDEILADQQYNHIGLYHSDGSTVVAFNPSSIKPSKRWEEIQKKIKAPTFKDGVYLIKCKNSIRREVQTDDYPIKVGDVETLSEPVQINPEEIKLKYPENVLTYDKALELCVELETLRLEKKQLEEEVSYLGMLCDDLEAELDDLEEERLSEPEQAGSGQKWLTDLVEMATPMIDEHFKLKGRQLDLETARLYQSMNGGQPPMMQQQGHVPDPSPTGSEAPAVDHQIERIQDFISQYEDQPEIHEQLAQLYNNAQSLDHFLQSVQDHNEELFNAMVAHVNS